MGLKGVHNWDMVGNHWSKLRSTHPWFLSSYRFKRAQSIWGACLLTIPSSLGPAQKTQSLLSLLFNVLRQLFSAIQKLTPGQKLGDHRTHLAGVFGAGNFVLHCLRCTVHRMEKELLNIFCHFLGVNTERVSFVVVTPSWSESEINT